MNNKIEEDLKFLKELINNLDEKGEVFKLTDVMIDANEKVLKKEINQKEREKKVWKKI